MCKNPFLTQWRWKNTQETGVKEKEKRRNMKYLFSQYPSCGSCCLAADWTAEWRMRAFIMGYRSLGHCTLYSFSWACLFKERHSCPHPPRGHSSAPIIHVWDVTVTSFINFASLLKAISNYLDSMSWLILTWFFRWRWLQIIALHWSYNKKIYNYRMY